MDWNLKKMWLAAATSLVAFTSVLSAADDMQMRNLENRVTALEQRKGANGMINPSARPGVRDGSDVFITGAALYWKPNEDGLEYAVKNHSTGSKAYADDGRIRETNGKYSWGFKAGLGWNTAHDGWDLYANWTRFHTSHSRNDDSDCFECDKTLFPVLWDWAQDDAPAFKDVKCCQHLYVCEDKASWKLNIDFVDLELGREFFVSKYLDLRPFIGLRWDLVRQHQNVEYKGMFAVEDEGFELSNFDIENEIKNRMKHWGLGPRAGLNTNWSFGSGFSLYGQLGISLLYGKLRKSFLQFQEIESEEVTVQSAKQKGRKWLTRAMTDVAIGLQWDRNFSNDNYHIGFNVGWEHHMWFGMNQFFRHLSNTQDGIIMTTHGDLATQGWTFGGRFDF